jgi:hypothetical protein
LQFLKRSQYFIGTHNETSPLFEIAFVLVRFDRVASFIVNANHGI